MSLPKSISTYSALHLERAFGNRLENIQTAIQKLSSIEFDAMVCTGVSGIMFASPLSLMMNKHIVVVRKPSIKNHSYRNNETSFEYYERKDVRLVKEIPAFRWIFIDDLIESGETFNRVARTIESQYPSSKYVGRYLYDSHRWDTVLPKQEKIMLYKDFDYAMKPLITNKNAIFKIYTDNK